MAARFAPQSSTRIALLLNGAVFASTLLYGLWLQTSSVFPDPDTLYHMAMAELIAAQGVVLQFPWAAFTGLTQYYTDQHLLYHVTLIPFMQAFGAVGGVRIATAVINAALFTVVAGLLQWARVRWWYVYLAILLVTNPFLFRINLVKAPGFSLILLLCGVWLLFARRRWPLAVLSFFYVWAYGGFPLLAVVAGCYTLTSIVHDSARRRAVWSVFRKMVPPRWVLRAVLRHPTLRLLGIVLAGLVAGVLINPYFPQNLFFGWQQLVQIGIVNFQDVVNVGGEWRPYAVLDLLTGTVFVSLGLLLAAVGWVGNRRRWTQETWALGLFTLFLLLITLKSRRYVELYVPFALLFAAFAHRDSWSWLSWRALRARLARSVQTSGFALLLVIVAMTAASAVIAVRDVRTLARDLRDGERPMYLAAAAAWLADHTPKNSIIVHSDWDEFPHLLYYNRHNRYIVGLDPTFMYQYDRKLYQRWADLTSGTRRDDATTIITKDLQSATVLVTKDHPDFLRTMTSLPSFRTVYEDDETVIFQLRETPRAAF